MIVQVQVHVHVYVQKPEFSVNIVTLDHADVGDPFHGWKSDAKMYHCICLQTDHKIPNMLIKIRSEHDRMCL